MFQIDNASKEFSRCEIFERFFKDLLQINKAEFKIYRLTFDYQNYGETFKGYGDMFRHFGDYGDFILVSDIAPTDLILPDYEKTNPETSPYFRESCIVGVQKPKSYEAIRVSSQKVTSCSQTTVHYIKK